MKYANESDLVTGAGSAIHGGRWNPRGLRAIYGSLDVITAVKESYQLLAAFGFTGGVKPRVIAGAQVKVRRVLDLKDAQTLEQLGFTERDLVEEDWRSIQFSGQESWTQAIAKAAVKAGFEAVRAPSAQNSEGVNFVIYPDHLLKGSFVLAAHPHELPPHPSRWK